VPAPAPRRPNAAHVKGTRKTAKVGDAAHLEGFDQNSLTSIDQSGQLLGLQAIRLLIERIAGRERAEHFVITPRLVVRGSSSR
jgi:DNA-binding LacI/PurR family transcriptional regulator